MPPSIYAPKQCKNCIIGTRLLTGLHLSADRDQSG
jgi:hypothetical protein